MKSLVLSLLLLASAAHAQSPAEAIFAVLNHSADDWNRADIPAFATSYKNSPDILFIGRSVRHGYAEMLASYQHNYPTPEKMGHLSFTQLEVQPLAYNHQPPHFATVTGHYHLDRTPAAGGNADGFFLLVMEDTPQGWKIIRDDTTDLPAK